MIQLVRVTEGLPEGFERLRTAADAEGFNAMARLAREWDEAPGRFVCLLAAVRAGELVAVGGLTPEPEPAGEPAMRMRRLYVHPSARRAGVGRTLANALLQEALDTVRLVTVNAGGSLAPQFWTAMGFRAVQGRPWTHEFRAGYSAA